MFEPIPQDSKGNPDQLWNLDLTTTSSVAQAGHAVSSDGDVSFFMDEREVSDLELTMSLGPNYSEMIRAATTPADQANLMELIVQRATYSQLSVLERHRLEAVSTIDIETPQVLDLKKYARNVADRTTLLEDSMPSEADQEDVRRAVAKTPPNRFFYLSEIFLERAWTDQRFLGRFKEFGLTLEDLLAIERKARAFHNENDCDEMPHTAIAQALSGEGLCQHFNRLIYDSGLSEIDRFIDNQKLRDKIGARNRYLMALGVFALGIGTSHASGLSLSFVGGVAAALLFSSGLSLSSRAVRGIEIDYEVAAIYGHISASSHAQSDFSEVTPECQIATDTPLARKIRNHHKILECGATIDALNLFGVGCSQIAKLIPNSRYDGDTSSCTQLRSALWQECQRWGINTPGQFRTVYRALHVRRQIETRIERLFFSKLAAEILLTNAE